MLIWLILVPVIAAALIGLAKAPARATALASATFTLIMGLWAVISTTVCPECTNCACWSTFAGHDLQFTMELPLSRIMLLLSVIVTFAAIVGLNAPSKDAERSWSVSALLLIMMETEVIEILAGAIDESLVLATETTAGDDLDSRVNFTHLYRQLTYKAFISLDTHLPHLEGVFVTTMPPREDILDCY